MSDENKAIARIVIERAWGNGEVDAANEFLSADCRPHDPAFSGLAPGAESFRRHIDICRKTIPDLSVSIDNFIAEHDDVVLHRNARDTQQTDFLGMASTRRSAAVSKLPYFAFITQKSLKAGPAGTSSRLYSNLPEQRFSRWRSV